MKALIFGINGQQGYYLQQLCQQKKIEVVGVSRSSPSGIQGSVTDRKLVENLLRTHQPEMILHVAANSVTSHDALFENHETIATGTLNILESARQLCPQAKIFITGSGIQFRNAGKPIKETDAFEASSAYSLARIHSVYAARYFRSMGMKVYVGYLFHHESPLRKPHHISKMTTDAIRRIDAGSTEKIVLGNITVKKEWAFAGDIAEGIMTLLSQDKLFEATIGTGEAHTIKEWLEVCFARIGKNWEEYVVIPDSNFTPEYELLVSDPGTIFSLGWKPKTSFHQLAEYMMR